MTSPNRDPKAHGLVTATRSSCTVAHAFTAVEWGGWYGDRLEKKCKSRGSFLSVLSQHERPLSSTKYLWP